MNSGFKLIESIDEKENNGNRRTRSGKIILPEKDLFSNELSTTSVKGGNSHIETRNVPLSPKTDSIVVTKNPLSVRSKRSPKLHLNGESPDRITRRQQRSLNLSQEFGSNSFGENVSTQNLNALRGSRRNPNGTNKIKSSSQKKLTNTSHLTDTGSSKSEFIDPEAVDKVEASEELKKEIKSLHNIKDSIKVVESNSSTSNITSSMDENLDDSNTSSNKSNEAIDPSQDSPKKDERRSYRRSLRVNKSTMVLETNEVESNENSMFQTIGLFFPESNLDNANNNNSKENNNNHERRSLDGIKTSSGSHILKVTNLEDLTNNNLQVQEMENKRESSSNELDVIDIPDESEKDILEGSAGELLDAASDMNHELTVGILDGAIVYNILEESKKSDKDDSGHGSSDYNEINLHTDTIFKEDEEESLYPTLSPSAESLDSAKGSSVTNENYQLGLYTVGDLYWAQIFKYCYWPCMVCPDSRGNITQINTSGRSLDQSHMVHVRFFADNGRRNWVKQENLLPFINYENFVQLAEEAKKKYGEKSPKYKVFVPSKAKMELWMDAIREANIIADTKYSERLETFYKIFEKSKNFNKSDRKRRQSMYILDSEVAATFGMESMNLLTVEKRERSVSPTSPAFSPISHKRRKLGQSSMDDYTRSNTSSENVNETRQSSEETEKDKTKTALEITKLFQNPEFKQLYGIMREYFLGHCQDPAMEFSLISGLKNLWALKEINQIRLARELSESMKEPNLGSSIVESVDRRGEGTIKRLSNRIKGLTLRKSLHIQTNQPSESVSAASPSASSVSTSASSVEKPKKIVNRPIEEVIDDIFTLDNKYLFRGLQRDPVCKYCLKTSGVLIRCSKKCLSWFHEDCLLQPNISEKKNHKNSRRKRGSLVPNKAENLEYKVRQSGDRIVEDKLHKDNNEEGARVQTSESLVDLSNEDEGAKENSKDPATCNECFNNVPPICCICSSSSDEKSKLLFCQMQNCQKAIHAECCKYWPQARTSNTNIRCPSHVCHTCVSDDPKGKYQHIANAKLVKCVKCPASYHMDSTCIPAGSEILTAAHIICPRHHKAKPEAHLNVNWCYICASGGGDVLCCETCPFAVHEKCLNFTLGENELYICEECESGRMPLYGEMVWVKFNAYRWWPAIILPPTEVPVNIMRKPHNPLEFVVRFFGTHDHGWISRRRVYLYAEGDYSENPKSKSALDQSYNRGVEEAKQMFEIIKIRKNDQRIFTESKEKVHPQPYTKIRTNRPVPPVKLHVDLENVSKCECKKTDENPCGPDSNCLNRVLYNECNPKICPAGDLCQNQMFEKRKSPRLEVVYMKERGFGLVTREPIKAGTFVIEYVGEVINDNEFQKRVSQKNHDRDENFYFLSVEKDYIIDAGPKGNLARFMNHSCDPNCETQKWCVNSINRVGLFAIKDIPMDTELTFNYHWDELLGSEKKTCYCGASKCAGQIGAKYKQISMKENVNSAFKIKLKKKKSLKRLQQKMNEKKVRRNISASVVAAVLDEGSVVTDVSIKSKETTSEVNETENESKISLTSSLNENDTKIKKKQKGSVSLLVEQTKGNTVI